MLRACSDLLRPGGRLGFFTIFPAPGLSVRDYRRAVALGPRAVATRRRDYEEMLATAGFEAIEVDDLTREFDAVTRLFLEHEERYETELRPPVGDKIYYGRIIQLEECLEGIAEGLLRRALFTARRPR